MREALIVILLFVMATAICGGPLDLKIVYPGPDQNLPPVDSNYIFGSVRPGSELTINSYPVNVHESGGWLAFLPAQPGEFTYEIVARSGDLIDRLTLNVRLPEPPEMPTFEKLYFMAGTFEPRQKLTVMPGARIDLEAMSLPYCNMYCVIEPVGDTVAMRELPPATFTLGYNVFKQAIPDDMYDTSRLYVRGRYDGSYIVPDAGCDSLQLVYHVTPPRMDQIVRLAQEQPGLFATIRDWHLIHSLDPATHVHDVKIEVLDPRRPLVVELTDSLSVIRTGPRKGYLCIHQPAGIRAQLIGKEGPWTKVRLSQYQEGWVPDTGIVYLPEGSTVPHSYIRRVVTVSNDQSVAVRIGTGARHAFRIEENTDEKTLTIFFYGADSDTDFLRFDNTDSMIERVQWFQPEPGLYAVRLYLDTEHIWGYDASYEGDQFVLSIRKPDRPKYRIADIRFVLDPGHSPDPGAIGPTGLTESEINLALCQRLKHALEKEGAEVVLTRSGPDSLPLYDRPKIAVKEKAEIFISIHNNALPAGTNPFVNNGVSTYYYHPHSEPLAGHVQKALARRIELPDFGLYYGNFAVIRPTEYPAILVECAFMMIPKQEALLRTENFQKKIAGAIVEGIKDFLRGHAKTAWERQQDISYGR